MSKAKAGKKSVKSEKGKGLSASVKVEMAGMDTVRSNLHVIEDMVKNAVIRGVQQGLNESVARFGTHVAVPVVSIPIVSTGKGSRKRAPNGAAAAPMAPDTQTPTKEVKRRHKASPRQRGSLERDARQVFDWIQAHPGCRSEDIAAGTKMDREGVSSAIKFLRGYNVRGDVVREPVICLPDGDKRRYTTYQVIAGSTFPVQSARVDHELPTDLMPDHGVTLEVKTETVTTTEEPAERVVEKDGE